MNDDKAVEQSENNDEAFSMNSPNENLDSLKMKVYKYGDERAFMKLFNYFYDAGFPQDLLPYSLVMSNKFNSPLGTFVVYDCIVCSYTRSGIEDIDSVYSNIAIEYLLKAAKMNEHNALWKLNKYKVKYNPKTNRDQIINMNSDWKKENLK